MEVRAFLNFRRGSSIDFLPSKTDSCEQFHHISFEAKHPAPSKVDVQAIFKASQGENEPQQKATDSRKPVTLVEQL